MSRKNESRKPKSAFEQLAILGSMPVTRTEPAEPFRKESGLAKFTREYELEEQRKKDAELEPARKIVTEYSRTLQQAIANDSATLYSAPSTYLAATCSNVGDASQFDNVPPDAIRAMMRRALSDAEDSITEGVLTDSGRKKCWNVARANMQTGLDTTQSATWVAIFTLLRQCGELDSNDFIVKEQPVVPEPPVDLLAAVDAAPDTREGQRDARKFANLHYWNVEAYEMFKGWEQQILRDYNVVLTDAQKQSVVDWFFKYNKSFTRHESFNEARRALGKAELIPLMLTEDELLAERLEHSDMSTYDARREFATESRRIGK